MVFEGALVTTIFVTARRVNTFFEEDAESLRTSRTRAEQVDRLRAQIRDELTRLEQEPQADFAEAGIAPIHAAADRLTESLGVHLSAGNAEQLQSLMQARSSTVVGNGGRTSSDTIHAYRELETFLAGLESGIWLDVRRSVARSVDHHRTATLVLSTNVGAGAALGILGIVLLRGWVLLPVQRLMRVADALGRGHLECRAEVNTRDELGQLAGAFNRMSAELTRIERGLVRRERLAASGELARYVAHNVRNPLAGIQSSAELVRQEVPADSGVAAHQADIISSIDEVLNWLRRFEYVCSPVDIQAGPTDLKTLIDDVVTAFLPIARRRFITIRRFDGPSRQVEVDDAQFQQALTNVLGNAIDAVEDHGTVFVSTVTDGQSSQWSVTIRADAPKRTELRSALMGSTGRAAWSERELGISFARKIVESHGGELEIESNDDGETAFTFNMVSPVGERLIHG